MSRATNDYRLILFDAPEDPGAVRDLISGVTGMHPTDAMRWVARAPGVCPRPLAEGEVRELLDGLFELKVPAEARRVDTLPSLAPPRTVHAGACLPDGFRIAGLRGEAAHWVPWEKVELVAAGMIDQPDEVRGIHAPTWVQAVSTGLNAVLRRPRFIARRHERTLRVARDPVGELILVRQDPRIAFRIQAQGMNYAYLGERLRPSAGENFPLLVGDIARLATSAYMTPTTRSLLAGQPTREELFPDSQSLLDYATHRLLWSWYRRDRAEQGGDLDATAAD